MHPNAGGPGGAGHGPDTPPTGTRTRPGTRRTAVRVAAAVTVLAVGGLVGTAGVGGVDPAPAAASVAAPAQSQSGLIYRADSAPDLLSNFDRTDFNEQGGKPDVVDSPNIDGHKALRFTVDPGGGRSEVLPRVPEQREGQTLFFGYSGYLAQNYPIDDTKYQIIMQWHHEGDSGSPPLAIHARNGQLILAGGDNDEHQAFEQPIGPAKADMAVKLVVRVTFSRDPGTGSVDIWDDGQQTVTGFHPPDGTLFDDGDYLKVGMYRDTSLPDTARVFVNNVAVGTDYESVNDAVNNSTSPATSPAGPTGAPSAAGPRPSSDDGLPIGTITAVALIVLALAAVAVLVARRRGRAGRS